MTNNHQCIEEKVVFINRLQRFFGCWSMDIRDWGGFGVELASGQGELITKPTDEE